MTYSLPPFLFITPSVLNSVWFVFCNSSSPLRSLMTYVHGTVFLTFFNYKNFFYPIKSITFWKNIFVFSYSYMIINLNLRIFLITFFIKVNICIILDINKPRFYCTIICLAVFFNYFIYFINIHIFGIEVMCL